MNVHASEMSREAVIERIKAIVIEALHLARSPDELDAGLRLDTLGLDSLNIVDILLGIERGFDVTIDEAELDFSMLESVSSLADFVLASRA